MHEAIDTDTLYISDVNLYYTAVALRILAVMSLLNDVSQY